jgi:hypothetical protein
LEPRFTSTSGNPIVQSCVAPGQIQRLVFQTAKGDIYQVDVADDHTALIKATVVARTVHVRAVLNTESQYAINVATGERGGLRIEMIAPANSGAGTPSYDELMSRDFEFANAGNEALDEFYFDRQNLQTHLCPESIWGELAF